MPTHCDIAEAERNTRYYGDAPLFGPDAEADDVCYDQHCSDCYPDGPEDCDCYDCEDARSVGSVWPVGIDSYSRKPDPVFWSVGNFTTTRLPGRKGSRSVFLGTEVEVEVEDPDPYRLERTWLGDQFSQFTPHLYCKEDGSLDNGVEVISHPGSLEAWTEAFNVGDLDFYRGLADGGCVTGETTGQHIHINRSSFASDSHMVRFGLLVLLNPNEFRAFADRSNESYASFQRFSVTRAVRTGDYGIRGAVNYGNRSTIEVRIFASTLDPSRILGNLELVHALHGFTSDKMGRTTPDLLTWKAFVAYLEDHAATYPRALNRALAI